MNGPTALAEENAAEGPGTLRSEDFSAFSDMVPGCLVFLGDGTVEDRLLYVHPRPEFDIVESCHMSGACVEVRIIADYLGRK